MRVLISLYYFSYKGEQSFLALADVSSNENAIHDSDNHDELTQTLLKC